MTGSTATVELNPPVRRSRLRTIGATTTLVVACTLALVGGEVLWTSMLPGNASVSWRQMLPGYGPFLLGAPAIAAVGVLFRPGQRSWPLVLLMHLLVLLCVYALQMALLELAFQGLAGPVIQQPTSFEDALFAALAKRGDPAAAIEEVRKTSPSENAIQGIQVDSPLTTFVLFSIGVQVWLSLAESRRRRTAEQQLRGELAEARLRALRMQLQPHFLFNTLNSISALIGSDAVRARRTVADLSELLRSSLEDAEGQQVTLSEELQLLDKYLNIQSVRFGDRLRIDRSVESATHDAMVPTLCLQPIVENSIVHAVERCDRPVRVTIEARLDGERLCLEVRDDGPGASSVSGTGIGLQNVRERLRALHEDRATLSTSENETGHSTLLEMPCVRGVAAPGES